MPPVPFRPRSGRSTVCITGRSAGSSAATRGTVLEVPVRALAAVRSANARLAARLTPAGPDARPADAGMTTAEYAVGTVAACGFSGVLYKLVTSPEVMGLLSDVIAKAFKLGF